MDSIQKYLSIHKYLDKVEVLPMSPTLLPKLLPKLSDVDTNFDEVVEIISLDPSLTSKLLQICNSAYFGHESEVTSVAEAVNSVGYQSVYLLVAMINGSTCFPTAPAMDVSKLWRHSITTAFYSKFIGESAGTDGNMLFTAGLLHDLGKVILGQEKAAVAAHLFFQPSDDASVARERELFGCTHAEVGAALLERWKLPTPIVVGVRHHHDPKEGRDQEKIAASVALGSLIAHSQERPQVLGRPELNELLNTLGLSKDHTGRWNERLRDHQSLLTRMCHLPL